MTKLYVKLQLPTIELTDKAKDSIMVSDAFFPFPDGLEAAADEGCKAILQPGGSMRDELVINAADDNFLYLAEDEYQVLAMLPR